MSKVSREKYESLKERAYQWHDKALDYQKMYEDILQENDNLVLENDELQDKLISLTENEHLGNTDLEQENKHLQEKIEKLSKRNKDLRNQIRQWEMEKQEDRLLEKLSKRLVNKE